MRSLRHLAGAAALVLIGLPTALRAQATAEPDCDASVTRRDIDRCFTEDAWLVATRLASLLAELQVAGPDELLMEEQGAWATYRRARCRWLGHRVVAESVRVAIMARCDNEAGWARVAELKVRLCDDDQPCAKSQVYDRPVGAR